MRRILAYALAAIIAAFLWVLLVSTTTFAANASWSGDSISYDGDTYAKRTADGTTPPKMTKGKSYYLYTESTGVFSSEANIIFFASSQPYTATRATYLAYDVGLGGYGSKTAETAITVIPKNASPTSSNAAWSGTELEFNGRTYGADGTTAFVSTGTNPPLPKGTLYFRSIGTPDILGNTPTYVIYFPSNTNLDSAQSAQSIAYSVNNGNWTANGASMRITVSPKVDASGQPIAQSGNSNAASEEATSCDIDGIGWIVCPVSNFLASGMDNIFEMLKGFLEVKPLSTDSSLYTAWTYMRTFANVAFVIAFLIIIYSQLTNLGINNYSIKKLLPRLIIAAVLVNVSYFICAIAVDLSNILGSSLQDIFKILRDNLVSSNTNNVSSWQSVTGFILAGGTAAAAAAAGITGLTIAAGASAGAAVILLLPILLSLILAVLVALVVLAARQAVIILLIIVAPLAFVAYLLPNTEKWFEKWRSIFFTLLVFFPIFALIFGGSQLAGFLIRDNSDQINIILLGMFVQVAPLVLTPMLIKFSGSLVGKIAGMVNNPSKGLLDRTKNWAKGQSEYLAAKNMARTDPVRRRQVFRRFALGADQMKRAREDRLKTYQEQSDARWTKSGEYSDIQQRMQYAQEDKASGADSATQRYQASKLVAGEAQQLDIKVRTAKLDLENTKLELDNQWSVNKDPLVVERRLQTRILNDSKNAIQTSQDADFEEFKAGSVGRQPATANVARMLGQSQDDTRRIAVDSMRNRFAKMSQLEASTEEYLANSIRIDGQRVRDYAGGIHAKGSGRVLAQALTEQQKSKSESVANANAIIEHMNLNAAETAQVAQNISVKGVIVSDDIKEAALTRTMSGGVIPLITQVLETFDMSASGNEDHRVAVVEALRKNPVRPKFLGFGLMDQMTQGIAGTQSGIPEAMMDQWIAASLIDGKMSSREVVTQDKDTLIRYREAISRLPRTPAVEIALRRFKGEIDGARRNAQLWDTAGERKSVIDDIYRVI